MQLGTRRLRLPHLAMPHLPQPRTRLGKIIKGLLPLLIIGVLTVIIINFPALKDQLDYLLHKPKPGNTAVYPSNTRAESQIPIGSGAECGTKPIEYDDAGNPKAICDNYIYIPKARVAAPIRWPKSASDPVINEELLKGVLHYPGTAEPGQKGNVFLTGHSSYYWWANSDYKNVFSLVPKLAGGDEIIVYNRGIRYLYKVAEVYDVKPTDTNPLKATDRPVITLSTCVPIGTAYRRRIVRAVQVSPDPATARSVGGSPQTPNRLPGVR